MREEDVIKLISKLNQLTQDDVITWERDSSPISVDIMTDAKVVQFFKVNYKGQNLAVFEKQLKQYDGYNDRYFFDSHLIFAMFDEEYRTAWEYKKEPSSLFDLYEAIKKQILDVGGSIDRLLDDDDN